MIRQKYIVGELLDEIGTESLSALFLFTGMQKWLTPLRKVVAVLYVVAS